MRQLVPIDQLGEHVESVFYKLVLKPLSILEHSGVEHVQDVLDRELSDAVFHSCALAKF